MANPMQLHPSASVRAGTTLVPETTAVVAAFLSRSRMPTPDVERLVRDVHATLVGIAADASSISGDLFGIGYRPTPAAGSGTVDISPFMARISGATRQVAAPQALPSPSVTEPSRSKTEEHGRMPAPSTHSEVVVPFRRPGKKPEPVVAKPVQIELPITPPSPIPAKGVTVPASVQMDWIVCLEDGKKTRNLRRHLSERYGMTVEEYLEKWGLPASYPLYPPKAILNNGEQYEYEPLSGTFKPFRK